jgi:excisionase family DNA binding protein
MTISNARLYPRKLRKVKNFPPVLSDRRDKASSRAVWGCDELPLPIDSYQQAKVVLSLFKGSTQGPMQRKQDRLQGRPRSARHATKAKSNVEASPSADTLPPLAPKLNGSIPPPSQDLLTTREAAALLRVSCSTLERWRSTGHPALPFHKLGTGKRAPVLYTRKALLDLLEQNTHVSTSSYRTRE